MNTQTGENFPMFGQEKTLRPMWDLYLKRESDDQENIGMGVCLITLFLGPVGHVPNPFVEVKISLSLSSLSLSLSLTNLKYHMFICHFGFVDHI